MLVYCRVKASVINNNRYNSRCCDNPIENWICSWKLADFFSMGDPPGESVYHGVMATENPLTTTIHGLDQAWRLPTDTPLKGCEKPCGSKREPNVWDSLSNVYIYIKHSVYVALALRCVPYPKDVDWSIARIANIWFFPFVSIYTTDFVMICRNWHYATSWIADHTLDI